MGRASRKKNRLRGKDGGVYSKVHFAPPHKEMMEMIKDIENKKVNRMLNPSTIKPFNNIREYISEANKMYYNAHENNPEESDLVKHEIARCYILSKGIYHNYFITDKDVQGFLEHQSIKKTDIEKMGSIIEEYCPLQVDITLRNEGFFAGVLHFIDQKHSLYFHMLDTGTKKILSCTRINDNREQNDTGYIYLDSSYSERTLWVINDKGMHKNWNILLNFFLYIDAFPLAIINGPPPVKRLDLVKSLSSTTISSTEAIRGFSDLHMSPHLRRGHYRFLKSDRYKKKRFQTVYVKPSMVKGTADHVVDIAKKGNLNDDK